MTPRGALLEVGCRVPTAIFTSGFFGAMPMPKRPRHVWIVARIYIRTTVSRLSWGANTVPAFRRVPWRGVVRLRMRRD